MTSGILLITVVASFWGFVTISAIRSRVSWLPMTLVAPVVFCLIGAAINALLPPWGTAVMCVVHGLLWLLMIWLWLANRLSDSGKVNDES